MNKNKILYISLMIIFLSIKLFANGIPRGGGIGVQIDNKVVLLDLLEAGIDEIEPNDTFINPFVYNIEGIEYKTMDVLETKIQDIAKSNFGFAWALSKAISMYNWSILDFDNKNKFSLCIPEFGKSILNIPEMDYVTLAIRQNKFISIDKKFFDKLNPTHQAGLILHEVIYGMLLSKKENKGKSEKELSQITRDIVKYIFKNKDYDEIYEQLNKYLPISFDDNGEKTLYSKFEYNYSDKKSDKNYQYLKLNPSLSLVLYNTKSKSIEFKEDSITDDELEEMFNSVISGNTDHEKVSAFSSGIFIFRDMKPNEAQVNKFCTNALEKMAKNKNFKISLVSTFEKISIGWDSYKDQEFINWLQNDDDPVTNVKSLANNKKECMQLVDKYWDQWVKELSFYTTKTIIKEE